MFTKVFTDIVDLIDAQIDKARARDLEVTVSPLPAVNAFRSLMTLRESYSWEDLAEALTSTAICRTSISARPSTYFSPVG
jgi:hypothetical protein